ncbi:MAG: hypothetical protein GX601_20700 [Anaerolineales bacterium]|nr:hypothetical protein [Anaerolineales bacterium]
MGLLGGWPVGIRVGVDLGQAVDYTAIVTVEAQLQGHELERVTLPPQRGDDVKYRPKGGKLHFLARKIERFELGTPYPTVVERLAEIDQRLTEERQRPHFWVDVTGLGQPVVDFMERAGIHALTPVSLTASDQAAYVGGALHLGKAPMVARLLLLAQDGRLHLPAGAPQVAELVQEMKDYQVRVTEAAHAVYEAKAGAHDDLVTALGLACWDDSGPRFPTPGHRRYWPARG